MSFDVTILLTGLTLYHVHGTSDAGGQDREVDLYLLNPRGDRHTAKLHVTIGSPTGDWRLAPGDVPVLGQALPEDTLTRVPRQALTPADPVPDVGFEHQFQWVPSLNALTSGTLDRGHRSISHTIQVRGGRLESNNLGKSSGTTLVWQFFEDGTLRRRQALAEWVLLSYKNLDGDSFPVRIGGETVHLRPDPNTKKLAMAVSNMPERDEHHGGPPYVVHHFRHFYPLLGQASGPLPETPWKPDRAVPAHALTDKVEILRAINAFCPPASWTD